MLKHHGFEELERTPEQEKEGSKGIYLLAQNKCA